MKQNADMAELRGRHAQKMNSLYREFLHQHPEIDADLDQDTWTPEQTQQWWDFTEDVTKRFVEARRDLAVELRKGERER